ncbi:MAG: M14 family metallopeptidase [Alphaproteobacteria bacterium]
MTDTDLFSPDYRTARERFVEAAARCGADRGRHGHPRVRGPDGETLSIDWAALGPAEASRVILIQSGTHGVEGFCGSACQLSLMHSALHAALPADTRLVLIHALNPYGFAWLRRVTEDNVDLNRNFLDHTGAYPNNPGYEQLKRAISPDRLDEETVAAANRLLVGYLKGHGASALQAAISQGQYTDPDGLYFGGHGPAWSNALFHRIVADRCAGARHAVLIDIHTGLGPFAAGELITEFPTDAPVTRRARRWWGEQVTSTVSGRSVSVPLAGTIDHAFLAALPDAEATPVTLEFGTAAPEDVFKAMRADNWLHRHGDPEGPEAPPIKADMRRVFFPDVPPWRNGVLETFHRIVDQLFRAL